MWYFARAYKVAKQGRQVMKKVLTDDIIDELMLQEDGWYILKVYIRKDGDDFVTDLPSLTRCLDKEGD